MIKVQILTQCKHCNGEAYLYMSEAEDCQGRTYTRYAPYPIYAGSGNQPMGVSLEDFAKFLHQAHSAHEHTSCQGSMCFTAGDVWDDIQEVCDDCSTSLDTH